MVLAVEECLARISTALGTGVGGNSMSKGIDPLRVLNQAGRHFNNMHQWRFYERGPVHLNRRAKVDFTLTSYTYSTNALVGSSSPFTNYTPVAGDYVEVKDSGTSVDKGCYLVSAKASAGTLNMFEDPTGEATAETNLTISSTLHTHYVALPDDFKHIITITTKDGLSDSLRATTSEHIIHARAHSFADTQDTLYTVTYNPDVTTTAATSLVPVGGPPVPVLDIWPTPTANEENAYTLYYRRTWTTVKRGEQNVSIPEWAELLFLEVLQAVALGIEEHDVATTDARLQMVKQGSTFRDTVDADSFVQPNYGPVRHSAMSKAGHDGFWDAAWGFSSTSNPS